MPTDDGEKKFTSENNRPTVKFNEIKIRWLVIKEKVNNEYIDIRGA